VLADTTGCLIPQAAAYMVKRIKEITNTVVEVHSHSDFGLGVATSLAAVSAGAEVVHASVAGIGERTGNTPLEEIAVATRALLNVDMGIDFSKLTALGRSVAQMAKIDVPFSKPIIGKRTFTRESGMGLNLIKEMPLALFALNPVFVGQQPEYVLGKKSGLASVKMKLKDLGLPELSDIGLKQVLDAVKQRGIEKKGLLTDEEFKAIITQIEP
jgi:methanogen homocitrate synthase